MEWNTPEFFMMEALKQAKLAMDEGEVPVGAVLVCQNKIIARAHNQTERLTDVTAHAEILALTAGFGALGSKYLPACKLFVTLEPCVMCAGALFWAQLGELHFAASDPKRGYSRLGDQILHPKTKVIHGLYEKESTELLREFFASRRN
ncbi:nucleoside deaminase [Lunatimonas lonarensis]|nr:nucleoside deaminase [Lunatimonas lonarensis]